MTTHRTKLSFNELIREHTGTSVLRTESSNRDALGLLEALQAVAESAMQAMVDRPICASTPNKAGGEARRRVGDAFAAADWFGMVQPNNRQGYPDFSITMDSGLHVYVECKTFGIGKEEDTFRSLYLSHSIKNTVTLDGCHIVIGFELRREGSGPNGDCYIPEGYNIVDLHGLPMTTKTEWHAGNIDLYSRDRILATSREDDKL